MATATLAAIGEHPLYAMDPELIEAAAAGLETMATTIRDNGSEVVSAWTPLSGHYSGPGDAELFAVMTPVGTTATTVGDNLDSIVSALRTFKTTADEIKATMDQLKLDHASLSTSIDNFEPTVTDGPMSYDAESTMNWYEDEDLQAENTRIIQELSNCLERMHEAERTCANAIRGLHGLAPLTAGDGDYASGQYGVDEIADEAETPWGTAAFDDESCGESAWNTTVGMGKDLVGLIGMQWDENGDWSWTLDNALETYEGFGALIGRDPETNEFSWETFGNTWQAMGKDYTAWDRWSENPNAAFGQLFVNVVSSVGVVGIVGKVSKAGRVASTGRHGPDGDGPDVPSFDFDGVRPERFDADDLSPDLDGIDFDLELDKILDSDTDVDTSRPHPETEVPPVRDADVPRDETVPDRADGAEDGADSPADENPADQTPVDENPADQNPVDENPVDETPVDENPGQDTTFDPDGSGSDTIELDSGETVEVRDADGDGTPDQIVDDALAGDHTPSDGITPDQQKTIDGYRRWAEHAPDWLQPLIQGRIFNVEQAHRFDANEVYLDHPDGSRTILDSYNPGEAVISRKNTILGDVQPATAKGYIDEFVKKYPTDERVTIANVPSSPADLVGQPLRGPKVLEVPVQVSRVTGEPVPIPQSILDYASSFDIDIIDIDGTVYN